MTSVAAIVGATASGKTDLSLRVARRLGAEIVSIDSMQLYRGMDIGTAKPSREQRGEVPHHLIDVVEPDRDVSVAEFQDWARAAIEEVAARGRVPLLVGGSGLYFRAVVDDLVFPPRSPGIRAALEAEVEALGANVLHERLRAVDAVAAGRIEAGNVRRIVRALEVIEITGRRFSENAGWEGYESIYDLAAVGLGRTRADLYERIERRVDGMLANGLVEEARALERRGLAATARQALGYRQVFEEYDGEAELRDSIVRATKRFARRQESWFRADPRIVWMNAAERGLEEAVVAFFEESLALT